MDFITNRAELLKLLNNDNKFINFLKENKLIKPNRFCTKCNSIMELKYIKKTLDNYHWICGSKKCRNTISIKTDSIFYQFKYPIKKVLEIIMEFSNNAPIQKVCSDFDICQPTVSKIYIFCQDLIDSYFTKTPIEKIGGNLIWVEIDETCLFKRKYNQGRIKNQIWLFGGVERDTKGEKCFIKYVMDRTKETLEREIIENIYPQSVILSDCWKSYNNIENIGYFHLKVNHSKNFVDPIFPDIHTQSIESLWGKLKKFFKKKNITRRERMEEHIQEFIFRQRKKNIFIELLKIIIEKNNF